jgi:dihydroorotate dehydrogenase
VALPVLYEYSARPVLFRLGGGDAETAHDWTLARLRQVSGLPPVLAALRWRYRRDAPREVFGLRFPSPVGLAPGLDKDGEALPAWAALGFGFLEVGTVTWHPQPGNDKPRMFRLRASEAVINRMGFSNQGARALARRLAAARPPGVPVGVSLGKSKLTPLAEAVDDYLASLRVLYPYGDYFVINVSSPNTPGLRSLQDAAQLDELLGAVRAEIETFAPRVHAGAVDLPLRPPAPDVLAGPVRPAAAGRHVGAPIRKPVLVKIAPDLTDQAVAEALEVCLRHGVAGVVATNTTIGRDGLDPADQALGAAEAGGLSGRPLAARAAEVVAFVHRETGGRLPVVGVGGILAADDALRLMDAGASLVQLCTGLIYRGPALVRKITRALAARPAADLGQIREP